MNRRSRKLFSWTVITGLIFNLLSPLFLLPWQQVWACFGSWDCGGNAYCAGAGSYPDHPGSCASYGERGNNDRTTSEIARDYINSGGNPAEVVTRTSDFQGRSSNDDAAAAAAKAQELAVAEAQRIAAEQAAAAVAAANAAAAKAADDKTKAEAQRLAQEAAERSARAAANAAAAATAMTAIGGSVPSGTPATGATVPAAAAPVAAAGAACGSSTHNACSPNSDGNWYRCNNGSWQSAPDCKPAGAINCVSGCAGASGCMPEGTPATYNGVEKVCRGGRWDEPIPQDPNPEEAMETWLATEDERLADRRLPLPTAVNSSTARPIAAAPTTAVVPPTSAPIPTAPAQQTDQEQVLEKFRCGERGGTWTNDNTCQSPGRPSPTIIPNPTAIIGPVQPALTPTAAPTQSSNFFTPFDRRGERGGLAPTLTPIPTVKFTVPAAADREDRIVEQSPFSEIALPTNRPGGASTFSPGEADVKESKSGTVSYQNYCDGKTLVTKTSHPAGGGKFGQGTTEEVSSQVCQWGCDDGSCRPPTSQEVVSYRRDVVDNAIDAAKVRCTRSGKTNCDTAAVYGDAMQNADPEEKSPQQVAIRNSGTTAVQRETLIQAEYNKLLREQVELASMGEAGAGMIAGPIDQAGLRQLAEKKVDETIATYKLSEGGGNTPAAVGRGLDQIGELSAAEAQRSIDQQGWFYGTIIAKPMFCGMNNNYRASGACGVEQRSQLNQQAIESAQAYWTFLIAGTTEPKLWHLGMTFGDPQSPEFQGQDYDANVASPCGVTPSQRSLTKEENACLKGKNVEAQFRLAEVEEQNQTNAVLNVVSAAAGFAGGAIAGGARATSLIGKTGLFLTREGIVSDVFISPLFAENTTAGQRAGADALAALAESPDLSQIEREIISEQAAQADKAADQAYTENLFMSVASTVVIGAAGSGAGRVAREVFGETWLGRLLLGNLDVPARRAAAGEVADALNNEVIAPASLFPDQVSRRVVSADDVLAAVDNLKPGLTGNAAEALASPGVVTGKNVPVGEEVGDAIAAARTATAGRQGIGGIADRAADTAATIGYDAAGIVNRAGTVVDGAVTGIRNAAENTGKAVGEAFDAAKINLTGKGKIPVEVAGQEIVIRMPNGEEITIPKGSSVRDDAAVLVNGNNAYSGFGSKEFNSAEELAAKLARDSEYINESITHARSTDAGKTANLENRLSLTVVDVNGTTRALDLDPHNLPQIIEKPAAKLFAGEAAAAAISGPGQTARTVVFDPGDRTFPFRETPDLGGRPVKDIRPGVIVESGDTAYILVDNGVWHRYSDIDVVGGGGEAPIVVSSVPDPLSGLLPGGNEKPESFVKYLTGVEYDDPSLPQRMVDDHFAIKQKYGLPDRGLRFEDPIEYIRKLEAIADANGIPVRDKSEFAGFFEEYRYAGAVYDNKGRQIFIDFSNDPIKRAGNLEHELIHALQDKRYPSMPFEVMEYEAYVGANTSMASNYLSDPDHVDIVFTLIGASSNHAYKSEGLIIPWERNNTGLVGSITGVVSDAVSGATGGIRNAAKNTGKAAGEAVDNVSEVLPFGRKPAVDLEGPPVPAAKSTTEAFPEAGNVEVIPKGGGEPYNVDYDPKDPQALNSLRPGDTVNDAQGQGGIKNEDGTWGFSEEEIWSGAAGEESIPRPREIKPGKLDAVLNSELPISVPGTAGTEISLSGKNSILIARDRADSVLVNGKLIKIPRSLHEGDEVIINGVLTEVKMTPDGPRITSVGDIAPLPEPLEVFQPISKPQFDAENALARSRDSFDQLDRTEQTGLMNKLDIQVEKPNAEMMQQGKENIRGIFGKDDWRITTAGDLKKAGLEPKYKIEIDGVTSSGQPANTTFYFSDVFEEPGGRLYAIGYSGEPPSPKVFYKSNSHGNWRVAPDAILYLKDKGYNIIFGKGNIPELGVQEEFATTIATELQTALSDLAKSPKKVKNANSLAFGLLNLDKASDQSSSLAENIRIESLFERDPKTGKRIFKDPGYEPDYSRVVYEYDSTACPPGLTCSGKAVVFASKDGQIHYTYFYDPASGRVWPLSVGSSNSPVNELGTRSLYFDSGDYFIDSPYEYRDIVEQDFDMKQYARPVPKANQYYDVYEYIERKPHIREAKAAIQQTVGETIPAGEARGLAGFLQRTKDVLNGFASKGEVVNIPYPDKVSQLAGENVPIVKTFTDRWPQVTKDLESELRKGATLNEAVETVMSKLRRGGSYEISLNDGQIDHYFRPDVENAAKSIDEQLRGGGRSSSGLGIVAPGFREGEVFGPKGPLDFDWRGFRNKDTGGLQFPVGRPKPPDVEVPVKPGSEGVGGGGDSPIIYAPPKIPITESVASILAPIDPRGYKGVYDWLYHSLYEPSAKLGGQTWGDNANRLSQILNDQINTGTRIPQEQFNFYLLGAASSQSVREAAQFVDAVPAIAKNLNIVDLSVGGFKRSAQIQSEYPGISMDFRVDDIRSASFLQESADVISADYVFNFIPREQWLSTLTNQRNLLKQDGILAIAFEAKGSGVGASLENLLRQPPRIDEITAILHSAGYEDIKVELISKGSVDRYFITVKKGSSPQLSNDLFQGMGGGGAIGAPGFREGEVFGPKGPLDFDWKGFRNEDTGGFQFPVGRPEQ